MTDDEVKRAICDLEFFQGTYIEPNAGVIKLLLQCCRHLMQEIEELKRCKQDT